MKKLIRLIQVYLSRNKFDISSKKVICDTQGMADILMSTFKNVELANGVRRDIVILIISNNFVADPVHILSFFKKHYNLTINEFAILCYKVGMLSKFYVDNPIALLSEAIQFTDAFSPENIRQLENMLEYQKDQNQKVFENQVRNFLDYKDQVDIVKKDEDTIANELIDKWLNKNKK